MRRFVFRHVHGGEVLETDFIRAPLAEWEASPESKDPSWSVIRTGRFVRALRLPAARQLHASGALRSLVRERRDGN